MESLVSQDGKPKRNTAWVGWVAIGELFYWLG
jgi:hypothetical protein